MLALVAAYAVTQVGALLWMAFAAFAATPFAFLAGLARADLSRLARRADPDGAARRHARARGPAREPRTGARRPGARARVLDARAEPLRRCGRVAGRAAGRGRPPPDGDGDPHTRTPAWPSSSTTAPRIRTTVRAAGAATALLLDNQRLDAELRARLVELDASRARIVAGGRRRAPAPRARPPRRRPVTARRPRAQPSARAHARARGHRHGRAARHLHRRAQAEPRRAARPRARHPSGGALRSRARAGRAGPRRPRTDAGGHRRRPDRPASRGGRDGRLLRGLARR